MKYPPSSTINLPPTGVQCQRITRQCIALGIREPLEERVSNRREAQDRIWELRGELRLRNKLKRRK